jgi:hypothetical protein
MASINHTVTDQELLDFRHALLALENQMHADPAYADEGSRLLTIGVFRNLIDPDSMRTWIANKACEVFVKPVEKGNGLV